MKRIVCLIWFTLLCGLSSFAQPVRGIFSFADYLTRESRIGRAGRAPLTALQIDTSGFNPVPFDPALTPRYASAEAPFLDYLLERGLCEDALTLLSMPDFVPSDTLSWYRGLALFDSRRLEAANRWFSNTSGAFSAPALFYGAVSMGHLGQDALAREKLASYSGPYNEIAALQKAGFALISGNLEEYRQNAAAFRYDDFRLQPCEQALDDIAARVGRQKKSPLLAAAMSAVLPGSGNIYAGATGEGIAAFLTVGALGAITAEQWGKYGPGAWQTIVAGSLCGIFYIGNIYGSYVSVSVQKQRFKDETRAVVLYNIHVPLRGFFR